MPAVTYQEPRFYLFLNMNKYTAWISVQTLQMESNVQSEQTLLKEA